MQRKLKKLVSLIVIQFLFRFPSVKQQIRKWECNEKKRIPKIREQEGNEKSIPIIGERESEAFILGNGWEQEFLLIPDRSKVEITFSHFLGVFFHFEQETPSQVQTYEEISLFLFLKRVCVRYTVKSGKFHKVHKYPGNGNLDYWALNLNIASQKYLFKKFQISVAFKRLGGGKESSYLASTTFFIDADGRLLKQRVLVGVKAFTQVRLQIRNVPLTANKTSESPFHCCSADVLSQNLHN